MRVSCPDCKLSYDDAERWTTCPHERLKPLADHERHQVALELMEAKLPLRFNHQAATGPDHIISGISFSGMISLRDLDGEFDPGLFVQVAPPTIHPMKAIEFVGQHLVLRPPDGWDNDGATLKCGGLPIKREISGGVPCVVSYWRPDAAALAVLNDGGHVRLSIVGVTQPPVLVAAEKVEELP